MTTIDETTLAAARAGDAKALERVLESVAPSIERFAKRMCRHDADAADVTQDALLAVAQNLERFEGRSSFASWAFGVARNACSHHRRGAKNRPAEPLDEAGQIAGETGDPEASVARAETRRRIEAALRLLDDDHREVLLLRDAEGLSAAEAAESLGITVDALKSRLHRARRALHTAFAATESSASAGEACPDVIDAWSRETEGDLRAEDCVRLEGHVAQCARCGVICDSLRRELGACAALREGPVGEGLQARIAAAVAESRRLRANRS